MAASTQTKRQDVMMLNERHIIENEGYHVVRFWNAEVIDEIEAVLDTIFAIVQQRQILLAEADRFHPTPAHRADPLSQGEGEEP